MSCYGSDYELIRTAGDWLRQGHPLRLVTVLKTWGSSPRPAGSMLVMRKDGVHLGSVSGGCVEEDLIRRFRDDELSERLPVLIDYGVNREEAARFGLPCGGRLELLIESLTEADSLQPLLEAMQQQRLPARAVDLKTGAVVFSTARPDQEFSYTEDRVSRVFGPQWRMLLIGAGHLSRCVSRVATMLDYRVIVCDPREEYAESWSEEGTELTTIMPDEAVAAYTGHERTVVIALTHDPKLDDMALLDALESDAFYVGAIGSVRNCEARRKRLLQMGLTTKQVNRLRAPVGLAIGSHTPAEIAVSILAEVTARRNAVKQTTRKQVSAA
ncbi:MAG: XdhC family protein [Pseudomonadota bacterium]